MKKRLTSKLSAVLLILAIMVLISPMPQVYAATTPDGFEFEEYAFSVKITGYTGGGGAVVVPEKINGKNVVEIGYRAFFNKLNITTVSLPNTVSSIGAYAFGICENLASINIPDSVITIGARAFEYCRSLHNFEFGKGVQYIGDNAFTSCNELTSVSLPPLMTKIYDDSFYGCQNLAEVTIPAGITLIETSAFRYVPALKDIYFLGDAPSIAWDAFPASFNGEFTGLMHFYQHSTGFTLGTWSPYQYDPNDTQIYHTVFLGNYNGAVLSAGSAIRTSDTTATVKFTSDKAGWSFDEVVEPGATPPAIYASGKGRDCTIGENTFDLIAQDGLTAGAKDIFIKVKDLDGNGSPLLKIELPAYGTQPAPTVTKVDPINGPDTGGTTVAINGTGLSTVSAVKFGSTAANSFTLGNDTSMTAVSPAGTGTVDVTVYSPGGGWSAVNADDQFTYTTIATYTVTYNGNGSTAGTVPVDSTTYTQGTTVTVLGNTGNLVRTGYTFGGWNTKADGSGTGYAAGATFVMESANVTLYAKWIYTLEITDNTVPVTTTIPESITDAIIDVSSLLSSADSTLSGTLPGININVTTSMSTEPVKVDIPAGTIVSAPIESGWDGTIHVPAIKEIESENLGLSNNAKVDSVVEIGFDNIPLTFDKAVRLVFPGKSGKRIGYSRNGNFTEITTKLAADTQEAADALPAGQEGKIDVDSDLVVWTKHFTYFALYTRSSSGGGGGSSGGGSTDNPGPNVLIPERLAGNDRFETAIAIAEQGWKNGADNVVLVYAYNFPDALTAAPLAKKLNAPILLTDKAELPLSTLAEIKKLNAKKITLIGGTGIISKNIQDSLSATYGQDNVIRYGGTNRYATAAKIAAALGSLGKAAIVNGEDGHYPDALAISSYAACNGIPILFTEAAKLPAATAQALTDQKVNTTIVVGGEGAVSSGVFNQLPGAGRYGGADRYATAAAINNGLQLKIEQVYVVTGFDFPDALAAGNLAAYTQSPLLMVNKELPEATKAFLTTNKAVIRKLTIIGGEGVITPTLESDILNALK